MSTLLEQLRERIAARGTEAAIQRQECIGASAETREQYEERIMNDDSAWKGVSGTPQSILPSGGGSIL